MKTEYELAFRAIAETEPGPRWQRLFEEFWPAYKEWFLRDGDQARPTYATCLKQLTTHMPELSPTYERITELAGGGDISARFLSLYNPPPYVTGCSQAVWPGDEPILVRNYDYSPSLCEGVVLSTIWNGRKVVAMSDCLWGAVDGMNEAGLVVSLTFGGRRVVGDGFGVPVILRYILEFCETVSEGVEVLSRVPTHMAYNVTVLDRQGSFRTAYLSPDRPPIFRQLPVATNHQGRVEWHRHARATSTLERERFLFFRLSDSGETADGFAASFMRAPLYSTAYSNGFGTLYTAVYRPQRGEVEYRWPNGTWRQSFDRFEEGKRTVRFTSSVSNDGVKM